MNNRRILCCLVVCLLQIGASLARAQNEGSQETSTTSGCAITQTAAGPEPGACSGCGSTPGAPGPGASAFDLEEPPNHCCWFSGEYLLWWEENRRIAPLFGTAPAEFAGQPVPPGAITPTSQSTLDYGQHSGFRATFGGWLNQRATLGVEAGYFQLERRSVSDSGSSNGDPLLGPIFFDPASNELILLADASAGTRAGTVGVFAHEQLWGVEGNVITRLCAVFSDRADLLLGFRHLQFSESVDITGSSSALPTTPFSGNGSIATDSFLTRNLFFGPQIGVNSDFRSRRLFMTVRLKCAVGLIHEQANIQGSTLFVSSIAPPTTVPGGVFALPTNIGLHQRDMMAIVPEVTVNLGYQVARHLRAFVGYNYLYINNLLRAGDQIDSNVNLTQVPSAQAFNPTVRATVPVFRFQSADFWAQGLNFGAELRY